jgi:hypothetical protein
MYTSVRFFPVVANQSASSCDSPFVTSASTSTPSRSPEMSVEVVAGQVACRPSGQTGIALGTGRYSVLKMSMFRPAS